MYVQKQETRSGRHFEHHTSNNTNVRAFGVGIKLQIPLMSGRHLRLPSLAEL